MSQDEFTRALRWRENILNDPYAKKLMANGLQGHNEVSGFWRHDLGVDACCRLDRFLPQIDTIIDADTMLVLKEGQVAEAGSPLELMQQADGAFAAMVRQTGVQQSVRLLDMAERAAELRRANVAVYPPADAPTNVTVTK